MLHQGLDRGVEHVAVLGAADEGEPRDGGDHQSSNGQAALDGVSLHADVEEDGIEGHGVLLGGSSVSIWLDYYLFRLKHSTTYKENRLSFSKIERTRRFPTTQ